MRHIFLVFVLYFQTSNLFCQPSIPVEQIDSVFESIHVSGNDWAISLSVDQAGTVPMFDSLGNIVYESPQGTFLLLKIGADYFFQKLWYKYLDSSFNATLITGNRLKIDKGIDFNYTIDSILLAYKEWIYPFVYKDEIDNAYNVQQPADHEPFYGMYFKIDKKNGCRSFFTETSLAKSKTFIPNENLNYLYNSRTFTFRTFTRLISLVKENMKAFDNR